MPNHVALETETVLVFGEQWMFFRRILRTEKMLQGELGTVAKLPVESVQENRQLIVEMEGVRQEW